MESAHKLLFEYLKKFDLVPIFELDDFRHFFTPREDVLYCYVVEVRF